eukprot:COSAG04_NODE_8236_length_1003_cov_1.134956_2_plen_245_part_00
MEDCDLEEQTDLLHGEDKYRPPWLYPAIAGCTVVGTLGSALLLHFMHLDYLLRSGAIWALFAAAVFGIGNVTIAGWSATSTSPPPHPRPFRTRRTLVLVLGCAIVGSCIGAALPVAFCAASCKCDCGVEPCDKRACLDCDIRPPSDDVASVCDDICFESTCNNTAALGRISKTFVERPVYAAAGGPFGALLGMLLSIALWRPPKDLVEEIHRLAKKQGDKRWVERDYARQSGSPRRRGAGSAKS